jgi:GNAT superfamily N-acetyltransferase
MTIRTATAEELASVMNVLDGADLQVWADTVERRIHNDRALVKVSSTGTVLGVLLALPRPRGAHVEAIAVRPGRRDQGIGSALLADAADRWGRLTASFDPAVCDFYRETGFEVRVTGERCFGERV